MISRWAKPEEKEALQALWARVFSDGPEVTEPFFRRFPPERHTRIIPGETGIAAMASWLRVTLCAGNVRRCGAYIYAVATAPECRGERLAVTLLGELERILAEKGMDFVCLCPASASLYEYYAAQGYETAFFCDRFFTAPAGEDLALTPLDAEAYRAARRAALTVPYCDWDTDALSFLKATQTQFYRFPGGCAAVTAMPDGTLRVPELLAEGAAASRLCKTLGATRAEVFAPGIEQPRGMVKRFTFGQKIDKAYLGFALD